MKDFTPQMIIDDQLWLMEFIKFTRGVDVFSSAFLERAHLGYQRMMYLKWKYSHRMEAVGFAPCPSVDLIWHTHLCFPSHYQMSMKNLIGHVPQHKLLQLKDRNHVYMNDRDSQQEQLWRTEFSESLYDYAV